MKFINRYIEEKEGLIKGDKIYHCAMCNEPTYYIDICSEAPFCSDECLAKFYKEYWEAEKKYSCTTDLF